MLDQQSNLFTTINILSSRRTYNCFRFRAPPLYSSDVLFCRFNGIRAICHVSSPRTSHFSPFSRDIDTLLST